MSNLQCSAGQEESPCDKAILPQRWLLLAVLSRSRKQQQHWYNEAASLVEEL
jgi:hypothetical protein